MSSGTKEYISEDTSLKFLDRKLWLRLGNMLRQHKYTAVVVFMRKAVE